MIEATLSPTRIPAETAAEVEFRLTNSGPGTCTGVIFTITLPTGIIRLSGRERFEERRLSPGQSITVPLRIQAEHPGDYELTSPNFSYRDHRGRRHRVSDYSARLTVDPAPAPLPEPADPTSAIGVELRTTELPHDDWTILRSRITNHGTTGLHDLEITLSGQVSTERRGMRARLGQLPAGQSADLPFFVCARQPGSHVPVHLDLSYRDEARHYRATTTHSVRVPREPMPLSPVAPQRRPTTVRILFLAAEPTDTARLRLGLELAEMQRAIEAGRERDSFEIAIRPAVRAEDIGQALLDAQPRIVHFAGHGGGPDGSFAVEDEHERAYFLPVDALVRMFGAVGTDVECVLVNACSTERLAQALAGPVRYSIGMRQPVGDEFAIAFSAGFYQALAAGRPVEDAFDYSLARLRLIGAGADRMAPLLFTKGTGRNDMRLAGDDTAPGGRINVSLESECSRTDLLIVTGVFETFGIPADVRGSYTRRSAADLPWIIVIGFSAWAGGTFLKAALQAAGDEAGREAWRSLMHLIRALYQARKDSRVADGGVSLTFSDPPLDVLLPPDLPEVAYRGLCEIERPHPLSGILMWDGEIQAWTDAGDQRPQS